MAIDIKDFSNDLATDLGPLLALFGDSMTKQFLSESISFLDYIIFAAAPIGIITALVSTIRLCGSTTLRAFVGRSQEGQGAVEAELCTSTSRDVCELFTRGGIQRVLGRPCILELVYVPRAELPVDGTTQDSQLLHSREYFSKQVYAPGAPWTELVGSSDMGRSSGAPTVLAQNPNLSLNIGVRRPSKLMLWGTACIGIFLQTGVVVLASTGVWILGWDLSDGGGKAARDYAPIMFIVGTILMCAGMWGCAYLIGQTTQEVCFQRSGGEASVRPRFIWLQPGPQVIGDQSFDPFAYIEEEKPVRVWFSSTKSRKRTFEFWTYIAVLATFLGYIIQFIGVRGMKAWISLAQLAITVLMSTLRGLLRTQRLENKDNSLREMPDMVAGFELDWLAIELSGWNGQTQAKHLHATGLGVRDTKVDQLVNSASKTNSSSPCEQDPQNEGTSNAAPLIATRCKADISNKHANNEALRIRLQLANIAGLHSSEEAMRGQPHVWDDKHIRVRAKARRLAAAVGSAVTNLFSTNSSNQRNEEIVLSLRKNSTIFTGTRLQQEHIKFVLRPPPEFSQAGWQLDTALLEAILGLWMWTLINVKEVSSAKNDCFDDSGHTDETFRTSAAEKVHCARIVSFGLNAPNWARSTDIQHELEIWLGRSSVKLRNSVVALRQPQSCGLASLFHQLPGLDQWNLYKEPKSLRDGLSLDLPWESLLRFSGWSSVDHTLKDTQATEARNGASVPEFPPGMYRIQYIQVDPANLSILDICCQELFAALMVSLVGFGNASIGSPDYVEYDGSLRLEHPVIGMFATAFVDGGLGTYPDALMCIVPALREEFSMLDPRTMLPTLLKTATKYRHAGEWERAETLLQFGYTEVEQQNASPIYIEQALRSLLELYRWALSTFSSEERYFGLEGLKATVASYKSKDMSDSELNEIICSYEEVAKKFENGTADVARTRHPMTRNKLQRYLKTVSGDNDNDSRLPKLQQDLVRSIELEHRADALYQLCLITPECEHEPAIPKTALSLSARNNWPEIVGALLELGANPNDTDERGKRAICHCAERGHDACAKLLLKHNVSLETTRYAVGLRFQVVNPLHVAISNRQISMVKLLLATGSMDVNQVDGEGNTPLILAAQVGQTEIVQILLKVPRIVVERPESKRTPLSVAATNGYNDIILRLLNTGLSNIEHQDSKRRTPLWLAVQNRHHETVMLLVNKGANIEAKNLSGDKLLAYAVKEQDLAMLELLLALGANVNTQDSLGTTPLMEAEPFMRDINIETPDGSRKLETCKKLIDLLLQKGADKEAKDAEGMTLLAQAAASNNIHCLDVMLAHHADLETTDNNGRTPLMHAVKAHALEAATRLVEAGANLEATDSDGGTAISHAFTSRWTLQKNPIRSANPDAPGSESKTVLETVRQAEDVEIVKFLLSKGADGRQKDSEGITVTEWLKMMDREAMLPVVGERISSPSDRKENGTE